MCGYRDKTSLAGPHDKIAIVRIGTRNTVLEEVVRILPMPPKTIVPPQPMYAWRRLGAEAAYPSALMPRDEARKRAVRMRPTE
jgi:hypothetical protein